MTMRARRVCTHEYNFQIIPIVHQRTHSTTLTNHIYSYKCSEPKLEKSFTIQLCTNLGYITLPYSVSGI